MASKIAFVRGSTGIARVRMPIVGYPFTTDENPMSMNNIWLHGLADGGDWNNVKTVGEHALGVADMPVGAPERYGDDIAHIKKSYFDFADNHWAQGTCWRNTGYNGNGGSHEIEILLRWAISLHTARGYEIMYGLTGGGSQGYISVVRWEGNLSEYSILYESGASGALTPATGDTIRGEIEGTSIRVYRNGSLHTTVGTGGTFTEGQPGMGFWPADGAQHDNMGWSAWDAGDL